MTGQRTANRDRREIRGQIRRSGLTLAALGIFSAASIWAENTSTNPHLVKLFGLGLLMGAVFFVGAMGYRRVVGSSISTVTAVAGVALVFLLFWTVFVDALSSVLPGSEVPVVLVVLFFVLALLLAVRMARWPSSLMVVSWVAAGLVAGAVIQATWATLNLRPPSLGGEAAISTAQANAESPDIYYVVLDGYARDDVLLDLFSYDNTKFTNRLRGMGFDVPRAATANYSMTYVSLASALVMDYPIGAGSSLGPDERVAMYEVLGGANPVVETLRLAGYSYYHVESGWGGTRCGHNVDRCYPSPFLDESVWALLQRSALAGLAQTIFGHSFPFDGLDRLDALPGIAEDVRTADGPVAVFAHVLLPHPPTFITPDCEIRFDPILDGFNTGAPWLGGEEVQSRRKRAYLDQLECVNRSILEFVGTFVDTDDIVVLTADHGTDSGGQLVKPVGKWTSSDVEERLSPLVAIRLPGDCDQELGDTFMIVNSFRTVLRCAINADLADLPSRQFLVNVEENHPDDVVLEVTRGGN